MANIVFPFKRIENALSHHSTYLIELRLSSCNIISQECIALAKCNNLRYLQALDLSCNAIKLAGLMHLMDQSFSKLGHLKRLDLYYCSISGIQLDQMSADQKNEVEKRNHLKFESLEYLNLSYNKMGTNLASVLFGTNFGLFSS